MQKKRKKERKERREIGIGQNTGLRFSLHQIKLLFFRSNESD